MKHLLTRPIATPKAWGLLDYHELADLNEFGEGIDVDRLAKHMRDYGYDDSEPIILFEGKVIGGRHRHKAAVKAEVIDPPFRELATDDPFPYLLKDLLRRHLTPSQLAMAGSKLATLAKGRPKAAEAPADAGETPGDDSDPAPPPQSRADVSKTLGVSERSLDRAAVVEKNGTALLKRMVRVNQVSVSDAATIARLPKREQEAAIKDFLKGKAKTLADAAGVKEGPLPKKKPKKTVKSQVGKPKFDWKLYENSYSTLARAADDLAAAYTTDAVDEKRSMEYREAVRLLTGYGDVMKRWRERLNRTN